MYIDIIGIILTVIVVSPKYWYMEVILSIFLSTALQSKVTEVIAGGIFTTINESRSFIHLLGPLFLLFTGIGMMDDRKIPWIDLINPISMYRRPWPIIMIKTAIFRLAAFAYLFTGK